MKFPLQKSIVIAFIALTAIGLSYRQLAPTDYPDGWDYATFAKLPIQEGGRLKPLDTLARTTLMVISGKQSLRLEDGSKMTAIEWLAEMTLDSGAAGEREVFRIDHPDLVGLLGFKNEERKFFSLAEIAPHFESLQAQIQEVNEEAALRDPFEQALVKLQSAIRLYDQTSFCLVPPPMFGNAETTYKLIERAYADLHDSSSEAQNRDVAENALNILEEQFHRLAVNLTVQSIPSQKGDDIEWVTIGDSLHDSILTGEIHPLAHKYAALSIAYRAQNADAFSSISQHILDEIHELKSERIDKTPFEYFFNQLAPFYLSLELYILIFLVAVASWLGWQRTLAKTCLWLLFFAFAVHTFGIVARIIIQERPPVTNLYSSAIFVGWAAVPICLYLEKRYLNGIATAAVSLLSFCTLIVAHNLSFSGDTMEMMQAVLDSNFWLGTHVPTVTIGYSATFLAGFLGAFYLIRDRIFRNLDEETGKTIEGMVFGTVCFALFFSFTGTVLGGIWADQSWGRFWGWDPKENGALMIVLWNAVILHARWGKIASPTGIMQLAIGGNIITAWSWFGTNMLGVGLHSYGFTNSAFFWLTLFFFSQIALILIGQIPKAKKK